jgi:hypothetical protein
MAETTRGYLDNINQDGVTLPEGPVSDYGRLCGGAGGGEGAGACPVQQRLGSRTAQLRRS